VARDGRAVQGVARPTVVGGGGLETAERFGWGAVGASVQPEPGEQPLDGALRRTLALGGDDDRGHLCRRAPGRFALQLDRQVEHRRRRRRLGRAGRGHQRLETTGAPRPDPAVHGVTSHPHPRTLRPGVIAGGHRAHQRPPLGLGQGRVCGFADQRVTEQRHISVTVFHGASWRLGQRRREVGRSNGGRPGATRVGKQTTAAGPRREAPRRHRSEAQRRRPGRHRDRLNRVADHGSRRRYRRQHRVEIVGQHREPHSNRLGVHRETTQPVPHRPRRHPHKPRRCPAIPEPRRLGNQRYADHLSQVASSQKRVGADQHVRHRAPNTSGATRSAPLDTGRPANNPPPSRPPRPQPATTIRAPQLSPQKSAFDFGAVGSYNLQQCLRAQEEPSRHRQVKKREGPCAFRTQAH